MGVVALVLTGVLVSCGSGSADRTETAADWSHFEEVPLSTRARPLMVWTGKGVLIFGGTEIPGVNASTHTLSDGAVYDTTTGTWQPVAKSPFEPPLANTAGTWTGSEVLVVGVSCEDMEPEADDMDCQPGTVRAGAFDPSKNEWRIVEMPDSLGRSAGQYAIQALGSTSQGSLFDLDGHNWLRRPNGTWLKLSDSPIEERLSCLVDDKVVTVGFSERPVAATLELGGRRWKVDERTDVEGPDPDHLDAACAPDGAYVFSTESADDKNGFAHFDVSERKWEPVPPPPIGPGVSFPGSGLFVDGKLTIWGDGVLSYDATTKQWSVGALRNRFIIDKVAAGDRAILYSFSNGETVSAEYRAVKP